MSTPAATKPPTGKITFLFTDIVGSTESWEKHGDAFLPVLQAHNAVLQDAISRYGGYVMKFEGDAYKVAFSDATAAVRCAVLAQAALQRYPWPPDVGEVRVRMALHSGEPFMQQGDYFGPPVNRTARMLAATHGGQVLMSEDTLALVEGRGDGATRYVDQGFHSLRDLDEPIRLYQVEHGALGERTFPPPRSLNGHAHNLPTQRTSFIGREREIEQIAALLARPDMPLLTLTGPAGIGKTRLSLEAAAERIEWFPDGVWLVHLTHACDAAGAALEVAEALGITIPVGAEPLATVREWLSSRRCLLILDDCGHVPQASHFIRELLSDTPSLRCLATARSSLQMAEAAEIAVPEMSLPPEGASPRDVMESDAGRLFVEQTHELRPDFALSDPRARTTARLLRKIGGVPGPILRAAEMMRDRQVTPGGILNALGKELALGAEEVTQAAAARGKEAMGRLMQSPGLAALLQSLSSVGADRRELQAAERMARDALDIYRRLDDHQGIASVLRQIGVIAFAQQHHSRAVALLGAAHQAYTDLGMADAEAVAADLECARRAMGRAERGETLSLDQAASLAMQPEAS
jgi:class 3 adenylate cyclase